LIITGTKLVATWDLTNWERYQ